MVSPPEIADAHVPWRSGDQALPIGVPRGAGAIEAPTLESLLRGEGCVNWSEPDPAHPNLLFLRISARHYARLHLSDERLPSLLADDPTALPRGAVVPRELRYRVEDFLDDEDGDGDPLDPRELHFAGDGIQALLVRRGL